MDSHFKIKYRGPQMKALHGISAVCVVLLV